jgi:hypothetical protein
VQRARKRVKEEVVSSENQEPKSFAYHAQAVGLAASLTRPGPEIIPSLATASLSSTGGESFSIIRDYNFKEGLITFDEAYAYTTGNESPADPEANGRRTFNTLSTVRIKNLNITNMVHADLVVASVTSKHISGDPEGQITFAGSTILNLVVGGRPHDVVLDHEPFTSNPTYAGFAERFSRCRGQAAEFDDPEKKVLSCSLATRVGNQAGFKLYVPEFGTIYVAQVIMKPSYRRISMLRFKLGSPIAGSLEVGGGETNGVEYWP